MRTRPLTVLLAALAVLAGSLLLAGPVSAAERVVVVEITATGVPAQLRVPVAGGDTVRVTFRNVDPAGRYGPRSTGGEWDFDSRGLLGLPLLGPGEEYTVPDALSAQGTYSYRVGDGESFAGRVLLTAPAPAPSSAPDPAPAPGSPPPAPGSPAPPPADPGAAAPPPGAAPGPPVATGGTGAAGAPDLGPGFGALGVPATPVPPGVGPAPSIALPAPPGVGAAATPFASPRTAGPAAVAAGPGLLTNPPTLRGYGLPSALAAVLLAGVVSLFVRLLLAEPAARRRRPGSTGTTSLAAAA